MQIELTPEQEEIASRWIAAGRYPGRAALVLSGLQLVRRLEGARKVLNGSRADEVAAAKRNGFFLIDLTNGPQHQPYTESEAKKALSSVVEMSVQQGDIQNLEEGLKVAVQLIHRRELAIEDFNKSLDKARAESDEHGYYECDEVMAEMDEIIAAAEVRHRVPAGE